MTGYVSREPLSHGLAGEVRLYGAEYLGGIGLVKAGELDLAATEAKERLAQAAADVGADAVVAFRYPILGRDVEKSVLAYGIAVRLRK